MVCPILSAGREDLRGCFGRECAWYNEEVSKCCMLEISQLYYPITDIKQALQEIRRVMDEYEL